MTRKELKRLAKKNLNGNWGKSIGVLVVFLLITQIGMAYDFAISGDLLASRLGQDIWSIFITGALIVGMCIYNIELAKGRAKFSNLFEGFKVYAKTLGVWLLFGLIVGIGTIFLVIPGIILSYMYSQVFFVLAQDKEAGVWKCFKISQAMMKGHKFEFFVLQISFILWWLLIFVTGGLAVIFVGPYIAQTNTTFHLYVSGQYNNNNTNTYMSENNFVDLDLNKPDEEI